MTNSIALVCPLSRKRSGVAFGVWPAAFALATLLSMATAWSQPVITNLNPTAVPTTGGIPLILSGSGFGSSGSVTVNSSVCTTVSWSPTQVVCLVPAGQGLKQEVSLFADSAQATASLDYLPPVVSRMDPTSGSTIGGLVLTLYGVNFGTSGTVTLGGNTCTITSWSHNRIGCLIPAGQGLNQPVVVTVSTQTNPPVYFNYLPPSINGIFPASGPTTGGTYLTLYGSSLGTSGTVTLGGSPCTVSSWSHSQIQCLTPAGQGVNVPLVVTVAGQSAGSSLFSYSAPGIQSIWPQALPTEGGLITLSGTNFGLNGLVTLNGVVCPITNWTHTQITCLAPPGQGLSQPLVLSVGDQTNLTVSYAVNYAPPTLLSSEPDTGPASGGTQLLLSGTNFGLHGSVLLNGVSCPVLTWTQTNITCVTPPGQGTGVALSVRVGSQFSAPIQFSYSPAALCAPGTYSADGFAPGVPAPPGYYVPAAGATNPTPAAAGYFVDSSGATQQIPAPAGTYCPLPGMSAPIPAPPGYFVPVIGAATLTPAAPGFYVSAAGQATATPAPSGSYAPVPGLTAPIPALPGYYVPGLQATNPTPATAGRFVATSGASLQTPAPAGSYVPLPGMSAPIPAPPGYFVSNLGAATPTPAPPGYYTAAAGQASALPAPSGRYAPLPGMQGTLVLGDVDGDGQVSQSELNGVLTNYWPNSPWVTMTNFTTLNNGLFQFALSNASGWDFSVQAATNLNATNWEDIGVAYPVYQFQDPATNSPQRFYRLRWP